MKNIIILFISFIIASCSNDMFSSNIKSEEVNNEFTFDTEKVIVLYADNNRLTECCKLYLTCDKDGFISAKLYYEDLINLNDNNSNNNKTIGTLVSVKFDTFCDDEIDVYSADNLDDGRLEINTDDKFTTDITNSTELIIKFDYQGEEKTCLFNVGNVDFMIFPDNV